MIRVIHPCLFTLLPPECSAANLCDPGCWAAFSFKAFRNINQLRAPPDTCIYRTTYIYINALCDSKMSLLLILSHIITVNLFYYLAFSWLFILIDILCILFILTLPLNMRGKSEVLPAQRQAMKPCRPAEHPAFASSALLAQDCFRWRCSRKSEHTWRSPLWLLGWRLRRECRPDPHTHWLLRWS